MVYKKKQERETITCETCGKILKDEEGCICDKCLEETKEDEI